jgi:ribosome recycling factor
MGYVVRVNHPCLSSEERAYRIKQIKNAVSSFYMEVQNEKKTKKNG